MSIGMMPLEPLPIGGVQGVCSTCADPEHAPGDKGTDHPFTMRVKPEGYVLFLLEVCGACGAKVAEHAWLDLDLECRAKACDRQQTL